MAGAASMSAPAPNATGAPGYQPQMVQEAGPPLPDYGWAYFDQVRAEYDTFDDAMRASAGSGAASSVSEAAHGVTADAAFDGDHGGWSAVVAGIGIVAGIQRVAVASGLAWLRSRFVSFVDRSERIRSAL